MKLRAGSLAALTLIALPTLVASQQEAALSTNYDAVDANKPVLCQLPGRVRKLGGIMTYLDRRKPSEITASECEIRGGEYTIYDRANYKTALTAWREAADEGDATAQVYVGEIYEKGWVGAPDYAMAALWYAKAAEQNDRRAQRRLAHFYENGLGVEKNREKALALWRTALDLKEDLVLASEVEAVKSQAQTDLLAASSKGDALLVQLQEKDQILNALQKKVALAEQQLQESRDKQQQLTVRIEGEKPVQENGERSELEYQLQLAKQEVADREQAMQAIRQDADQQRYGLEQQLAKSARREADLSTALQSSRAETEDLALALKNSTAKLESMDTELTTARYALADKKAATESLREQLDALDDSEDEKRQLLTSKISTQEKVIADLQEERDKLVADWKKMAEERDSVGNNLAAQVNTTSWLDTELDSATRKLGATRDDLRTAELALAEANFAKQQLAADVLRLEEDLAKSRERGRSDREVLEDQLRKTRLQLAEAGSGVDNLRQEASRLESDVELLGERQQTRQLAMRGVQQATPVVMELPNAAGNPRYRAIIIANYEYDFLPDLSSPPNDANALKQLLEQAYGFDVEVLVNLNRAEMYKALAQLRDFEDTDSVLLYYAGHGKMDEYGDGYWLPTDYRTSQPLADTVSSSDLTQTMNRSLVRHLMVVADSCYSGALVHNGDPVIRKSVPALMEFWMANRSRTVLSSGGLMPVLDEGPGNHSVFAAAMLQVLEQNAGAINGEMLHAQVYDLVRTEAAQLGYIDQKPQFAAVEDAGHENGQFVFLRPPTGQL